MTSNSSNLIDLTLHIHAETVGAVLVSDNDDSSEAVWIPKSQCEVEAGKGNVVEVTLPEHVALEKGLI